MPDRSTEATLIDQRLREAYLSTHYNVMEAVPFTLKIGESSQELKSLYRAYNVKSAAFITAWNPMSEVTPVRENEINQHHLRERLDLVSSAVLPGMGVGITGNWPGEPSFLSLGVSKRITKEVGNEFSQNAVVWMGENCIPELVFLR